MHVYVDLGRQKHVATVEPLLWGYLFCMSKMVFQKWWNQITKTTQIYTQNKISNTQFETLSRDYQTFSESLLNCLEHSFMLKSKLHTLK